MKTGQVGQNRKQWAFVAGRRPVRTRNSEGISLVDHFCVTWAKMERTQGQYDSQEN